MPVAAQETYEIADLATQDLNGTARYVGMGGAMEALGADISTMSSNPAGIGLFRHNQVSLSAGLVAGGEDKFAGQPKTKASFDQLGTVLVMRTGQKSFLNFGFNYHKSRNFNTILRAADNLGGASQSKLTYAKFKDGYVRSADDLTYSQVDVLYHETLYDNSLADGNGNFTGDEAVIYDGSSFDFGKTKKGYIAEYDFNISGNINNKVFLGATIGVHDVNYRGYSDYYETIVPQANASGNVLQNTELVDYRDIDGTGADFKFGVIVRPIDGSGFRIGAYVNSPIYYSLTSTNTTGLYLNGELYGDESQNPRSSSFDYSFRTPWKFGLSVGHTVGKMLALGATYEYADYSTTDARINNNDRWYDPYWDEYYGGSTDQDVAMNQNIDNTLKGCSTFKLGAELKPDDQFAVRLGYNYISPMYQEEGYRDPAASSLGNYYSSETDFVNWKSTNRITAGFGFSQSGWNFDIAYQYSQTNGDFYPFTGYQSSTIDNLPYVTKVSNKRHQLLFTLGYTF